MRRPDDEAFVDELVDFGTKADAKPMVASVTNEASAPIAASGRFRNGHGFVQKSVDAGLDLLHQLREGFNS